MEKTYYTPEIEDLVIGLKVEYYYKSNTKDSKWEWKEAILKESDIDSARVAFSARNKRADGFGAIRVKHLDREDIEGEGWDFDQETKDGQFFYFGQWDDWALILGGRNGSSQRVHIYRMNHEQEGFCGTVLNLSEFRKLMKQLGIKK
jgi:hypothetical protein